MVALISGRRGSVVREMSGRGHRLYFLAAGLQTAADVLQGQTQHCFFQSPLVLTVILILQCLQTNVTGFSFSFLDFCPPLAGTRAMPNNSSAAVKSANSFDSL